MCKCIKRPIQNRAQHKKTDDMTTAKVAYSVPMHIEVGKTSSKTNPRNIN